MYSVYVYTISANCRVCGCDHKHRGMYEQILGDFQSCTQCKSELCVIVAVLKVLLGFLYVVYMKQVSKIKYRGTPVSLPGKQLVS